MDLTEFNAWKRLVAGNYEEVVFSEDHSDAVHHVDDHQFSVNRSMVLNNMSQSKSNNYMSMASKVNKKTLIDDDRPPEK